MQKTGMEGSNPLAGFAEESSARLGRITDNAQQAVDRITRAAHDAADRLSARTEELRELHGRALETARNYAKANPLATIGIAIALGVILSKLLSSRK